MSCIYLNCAIFFFENPPSLGVYLSKVYHSKVKAKSLNVRKTVLPDINMSLKINGLC